MKPLSHCTYLNRVILVASLLIPLVGCSKSHKLDTARVRGLVTLDGKPVNSGAVMFVPAKGRGALGTIEPDGTYMLSTYADADGAIVGAHSVSVVPRFGSGDTESEVEVKLPADSILKRPFRGINAVVEPGTDNVIDIPLSSNE